MFRTNRESRIKLQTNIDMHLHHRFKTACFLQGKGMNEVLTELIAGWLQSDEKDFPPAAKKKESGRECARASGRQRDQGR